MEQSDELNPIYGSRQWEKLNQAERDELGMQRVVLAVQPVPARRAGRADRRRRRIIETVPDMDSKFYSATQAMDEGPQRRAVQSVH